MSHTLTRCTCFALGIKCHLLSSRGGAAFLSGSGALVTQAVSHKQCHTSSGTATLLWTLLGDSLDSSSFPGLPAEGDGPTLGESQAQERCLAPVPPDACGSWGGNGCRVPQGCLLLLFSQRILNRAEAPSFLSCSSGGLLTRPHFPGFPRDVVHSFPFLYNTTRCFVLVQKEIAVGAGIPVGGREERASANGATHTSWAAGRRGLIWDQVGQHESDAAPARAGLIFSPCSVAWIQKINPRFWLCDSSVGSRAAGKLQLFPKAESK